MPKLLYPRDRVVVGYTAHDQGADGLDEWREASPGVGIWVQPLHATVRSGDIAIQADTDIEMHATRGSPLPPNAALRCASATFLRTG